MKNIRNIFKLLVVVFGLCHLPLQAQDMNNNYRVYAGLLYHFTKYVEWPSQRQQGDFVIGVYGDDEMLSITQNLMKNRSISNQKISVRKITKEEDIVVCHIVFVERNFSYKFKSIQPKSQANHILIVTEDSNLAKKGAGINFVIQGDKLKFEMNKSAIESAGLKVSNELVKLSIIVG
ncbi:MAG: hypothetical protein OHK0057_30520 [Thermoflexibacter sp.]